MHSKSGKAISTTILAVVVVVIVLAVAIGVVVALPGLTSTKTLTTTSVVTSIATSVATTTVSSPPTSMTTSTSSTSGFKLAVIMGGDETDDGLNDNGVLVAQWIQSTYGWNVSISRDVAYSDQSRIITTYAQEGYNAIWTDGNQFIGTTEQIATQFPKVLFFMTPTYDGDNLKLECSRSKRRISGNWLLSRGRSCWQNDTY